MSEHDRFYVQKLHECLRARQSTNPQYSLRAFARDLGVDPSALSKIMTSKRPLPQALAKEISEALRLTPKEMTLFIESTHRYRPSLDSIRINPEDDRFILDESYFLVIAEWEHYAVLTLFDLNDFQARVADIATKLNISPERARDVVDNLLACGLLSETADGILSRTKNVVRTTEDYKSQALKESHLEALDLGKEKLESIDLELRDFSSSTLALDLRMLPEAKVIIREFRMKMAALLGASSERDHVYQLAIQFYPLTDTKKSESL